MSNVNPPPIIWLRLKLDLLPIISQEVDKVSKDYYSNKKNLLYFKKGISFGRRGSQWRQRKLPKVNISSK